MIRLKEVNKTYPGAVPLHVLKGIDLEIDKGELVSIMGASGGRSILPSEGSDGDLHTGDRCGQPAGKGEGEPGQRL